mgnify:CR=1 FL=1
MSAIMVYITAPDLKEAELIGAALVEKKLVACVNFLDHMKSMYWWDGEVQKGEEVVMIVKTRKSLMRDVVKKVKELHSYQCPCVASFAIEDGNPDFLEWIDEVTEFRVI